MLNRVQNILKRSFELAANQLAYWSEGGLRPALLSFSVLLTAACSPEVPAPRPNIVIIAVDTLRADRLPFYGAQHNTAPFLNDLADRSLVFENAWSTSSWTLPATVSSMTSVYPFQHGVNDLEGLEVGPDEQPVPVNSIPEELQTLAEQLSVEGYRTYGVVSNVLVGEAIGFDRGFDRFVQLPDEDADQVNEVVDGWRAEILAEEPYFLYLHYFDPHDPFHAREPWFDVARTEEMSNWPTDLRLEGAGVADDLDWILTKLKPQPEFLGGRSAADLSAREIRDLLTYIQAAYDSEISFVDSRIEQVFESLGLEDAVVVFLADHGEEFYEHGDLTHGWNLYGETVRVPLLLHLPGAEASPRRVGSHVSTLDVVPTLREILNLPPLDQTEGQSLLTQSPRAAVVAVLEGKAGENLPEDDFLSIVEGDFRLIVRADRDAELYDLSTDRAETNNIAESHPEVVRPLLRELQRRERSAPRYEPARQVPPPPSPEMLEHLRGLGYLGN